MIRDDRDRRNAMTYDLNQLLAFFMFYSVVGWCLEVIYHAMTSGRFINRGFLNGPVCPIYGLGATIVILALTPLQDNLLLLYAGSVVLTSVLEFLTGFIMERIFHQRWWDYTDEHFNIMGYVCLRFSLMWGFCCVFVMKLIQPAVIMTVEKAPVFLCSASFIAFYSLFCTDLIITVIELAKIQARLRLANDMDRLLNGIATVIGSRLTSGTLKGMEEFEENKKKLETIKIRAGESTEELRRKTEESAARLQERYTQLREKELSRGRDNWEHFSLVHKRLEKAYPALDFKRLGKIDMAGKLENLKNKLDEYKN